MIRLLAVFVFGLVVGCSKQQPQPAKPAPSAAAAAEPPQIRVTADRTDLVFTWLSPTGSFHDTSKLEEIPEESRAQVLVRDLSKSPDELRADEFLYVADLREPDASGRFPCGVVSRRGFEKKGVREAVATAAQGAIERGEKLVVVYTTSWCGVCKRTKAFLTSQGVPFVERDVERDEGAEEELAAKAAARGLRPQGVPVVDVAGELMMGFDQEALTALLDAAGMRPPG